ncbi:MAG TPA: hypothetical protein VIB39_02955 [Candidatus Angelobacter sp.]
MKTAWVVVCCILLFSAPASFGQSSGKTAPAFTGTLSAGINLRSVAGAPFSADVLNQSTQLLSDGSRALVETHGKVFRDAEGRTHVETELTTGPGAAPRHLITIFDPLLQISMVLNVEARTGDVYHLPQAPALSAKQLKLIAAAQVRRNAARPTAGSEDLGTMTMEGFSVTGSRSTHRATGDKAQLVTSESWFSAELKVELLSITQLPQAVTHSTRLINIAPGAPDAALFQTPAGYTMKDHSQQK